MAGHRPHRHLPDRHFRGIRIGPTEVVARICQAFDTQRARRFWLHLDVDVLDKVVMPAVDSPGSTGLSPEALAEIGRALAANASCAGMTVTVFDPDLDPSGRYAALIVSVLREILCGDSSSSQIPPIRGSRKARLCHVSANAPALPASPASRRLARRSWNSRLPSRYASKVGRGTCAARRTGGSSSAC